MRFLISLRNHILAEGVKRIISDNLADATMADYCTNPSMDNPDLVLFDSNDFISDLMQKYAQAKFIYFDLGVKSSELACLLYCHGINGVISAGQDVDMFCKALRSVQQGEIWLEQKHLKVLLREGRSQPNRSGINCLSDQDKQIVMMVTQGLKN
jgi:DNA-binding NarL/FixJ family response regulator